MNNFFLYHNSVKQEISLKSRLDFQMVYHKEFERVRSTSKRSEEERAYKS